MLADISLQIYAGKDKGVYVYDTKAYKGIRYIAHSFLALVQEGDCADILETYQINIIILLFSHHLPALPVRSRLKKAIIKDRKISIQHENKPSSVREKDIM